MRREVREWIDAYAKHLIDIGKAKTMRKARIFADEATRCGAKTRKGTPCRCRGLGRRGRCKLHGGMSTGPKTAEGLARSVTALQAGWERWNAARQAAKNGQEQPRAHAHVMDSGATV